MTSNQGSMVDTVASMNYDRWPHLKPIAVDLTRWLETHGCSGQLVAHHASGHVLKWHKGSSLVIREWRPTTGNTCIIAGGVGNFKVTFVTKLNAVKEVLQAII
jgi:hypothetical protein